MTSRASDAPRTRRAANLSVDSELLREAKELGIKLSQVFEAALREAVQHQRALRWRAENREAIESYNAHIAKTGAFGDDVRGF